MNNTLIDELINKILHKIPGQTFAIKKIRKMWTPEEETRFERELSYLLENYSLDRIADGYIFVTNNYIVESKYFHEHGDYRYHSFEEVNSNLYADSEKMTLYMLGLSLAEFFWETILKIHRFFEKTIRNTSGDSYLEIGPGHGKYFLEAYNLGKFKRYVAVDVSQTAIDMTQAYINRYGKLPGGGYQLLHQDATLLPTDSKYDFIVAQEVLEHIENPLELLKSIHNMLSENGTAYVLMPINTPSPAHIYLFKSISHVKEIIQAAGLKIVEEAYITANGIAIDKAQEKRPPINAGLLLKKE